jgi:hypothetical protein
VELTEIPDQSSYRNVYLNGRSALVDLPARGQQFDTTA